MTLISTQCHIDCERSHVNSCYSLIRQSQVQMIGKQMELGRHSVIPTLI